MGVGDAGGHVEGNSGNNVQAAVVVDSGLQALSREKVGDILLVPPDANLCIGDVSVIDPAADTFDPLEDVLNIDNEVRRLCVEKLDSLAV